MTADKRTMLLPVFKAYDQRFYTWILTFRQLLMLFPMDGHFYKKKGKNTAIEFTKIYSLSICLSFLEFLILAAIIVIGAGSVLFAGFGSNEYIYNIAAALVSNILIIAGLSIPIILIFRIINAAVGAVPYLVVGDRKTTLISDVISLLVPVGGYAIAAFLLQVVVFIIPAAIMIIVVLAGIDVWIVIIIMLIILAITFAIWVVIRFLIQFGMLELVINKKGVIESIKASMTLAKENWKMILIFDVAMFIVLIVIGVVSEAVMYILQMFFYISVMIPPLIVIVLLLFVLISLIQSVLTGLIVIPIQYIFWKSVNGVKNG
ncbi:MAG: hypothetical protein ABID61_04920 [Candidatus Micrarchaeota archaeon]